MVYLTVVDANDNAPTFIYPVYPSALNVQEKSVYVGAITMFSQDIERPVVMLSVSIRQVEVR